MKAYILTGNDFCIYFIVPYYSLCNIFVMDNSALYIIEGLIVVIPLFMIIRTFVLRGRKLLD